MSFRSRHHFKPEAERVPSVVEDAKRRLAQILEVLDEELEGKDYLLGSELSGARSVGQLGQG